MPFNVPLLGRGTPAASQTAWTPAMLPQTTFLQRNTQPPRVRPPAPPRLPAIVVPLTGSERALAPPSRPTPASSPSSTPAPNDSSAPGPAPSAARAHTNISRSAKISDEEVGRRIRQARKAQGRVLKELAYVIGVTAAQLHRYEVGATRIATSRLIAIADALGVSPDTLLANDDDPKDASGARDPVPLAAGSADDLVELIQHFSQLDPKQRAALMTVARLMGRTAE